MIVSNPKRMSIHKKDKPIFLSFKCTLLGRIIFNIAERAYGVADRRRDRLVIGPSALAPQVTVMPPTDNSPIIQKQQRHLMRRTSYQRSVWLNA
jgi:hypothetical protein